MCLLFLQDYGKNCRYCAPSKGTIKLMPAVVAALDCEFGDVPEMLEYLLEQGAAESMTQELWSVH